MSTFNESNTVEQMILDTAVLGRSVEPFAQRKEPPDWGASLGKDIAAGAPRPPKWRHVQPTVLPRWPGDVMVQRIQP
jgi:hypothetical protein